MVGAVCEGHMQGASQALQGSSAELTALKSPPVPGKDSFIPHPSVAVTTCCPWAWHPHGGPKIALALRGRGVAGEEPEVTQS